MKMLKLTLIIDVYWKWLLTTAKKLLIVNDTTLQLTISQ